MKVLVFGGNGEIGHMICKTLSKDFDIFGTIRKNKDFNSVNFLAKFYQNQSAFILIVLKI